MVKFVTKKRVQDFTELRRKVKHICSLVERVEQLIEHGSHADARDWIKALDSPGVHSSSTEIVVHPRRTEDNDVYVRRWRKVFCR